MEKHLHHHKDPLQAPLPIDNVVRIIHHQVALIMLLEEQAGSVGHQMVVIKEKEHQDQAEGLLNGMYV